MKNINIKDYFPLNEKNIFSWLKDKFSHGIDKVKSHFITMGYFYNFKYKSKGFEENTLPYYDESPIILCIGRESGYTLGINTNYMPVFAKKRLVKRLQDLYPNQWDNDKVLPNVRWNSIKSVLDNLNPKFLIHKYINSRISKIVRVKNPDMQQVANIDLSNFIGASASSIWRNWKSSSKA